MAGLAHIGAKVKPRELLPSPLWGKEEFAALKRP
jgi:hypothetical protein